MTPQGVCAAMSIILGAHGQIIERLNLPENPAGHQASAITPEEQSDIESEEALIEAFGR